jgi:NADH dehydrogenase I D subunit
MPDTTPESADDAAPQTLRMNFGPQHPAMHGTLRMVLDLDGERIVRLTPEIGFLHSGFEKQGESLGYNQFVTVTDRTNYFSPLANNIGYAQAVERLMGLEIPRRTRVIRVILAELSRLADHVLCLGLHGMDVGAFSVMLWTFVYREMLYDLFEQATGGRLTTSMTRVGGLARDVPPDFPDRARAVAGRFRTILDELERMLLDNPIFVGRTRGLGRLSGPEAVAYGLTGPCLRASGVRYDLRRDRPYLDYPEYDFEVPTLPDGDALARFRLRWLEMRESLRIVDQALRRLEPGPINAPDARVSLPDKDRVYTSMEEMIHHFELIMHSHGLTPPAGEIYDATEAPNGELGFYLVSDGTRTPFRVRYRGPSFYNYQAIARMLEGHQVSDIVSVLASLNVIAGELDR